jgi:hypothetical protein
MCKTQPDQHGTQHKMQHQEDDQRACGECWEAYLSLQVEERLAENIECMFCTSLLPRSEIDRLSKEQTLAR